MRTILGNDIAIGKRQGTVAPLLLWSKKGATDEVAEAIGFLATDRASFIYGAKLAVDGGGTAI